MKSFDESEWARTKSEPREHLSVPQPHDADFVNNQGIEKIEQQKLRAIPKMLPLGWLAWSGAFSLLLAIGLTALVLPRQVGGRIDADFSSKVISVQAELPSLSVSEFQAPDQRGAVIWIEGADYIAAEAAVR
jgi:hypothetical protein